jgi:hypothetical protein
LGYIGSDKSEKGPDHSRYRYAKKGYVLRHNAALAVCKKEKAALRKNENDHSTNRANREINLEWAGRESHSHPAGIILGVVTRRLLSKP